MMELVDIPGMSQIFRIYIFGTCNQKNTKVDLRDPNCGLKNGPPKIWVGGQFGMVGGPLRKKTTPDSCPFIVPSLAIQILYLLET